MAIVTATIEGFFRSSQGVNHNCILYMEAVETYRWSELFRITQQRACPKSFSDRKYRGNSVNTVATQEGHQNNSTRKPPPNHRLPTLQPPNYGK